MNPFALTLGLLITFGVIAKGAHDLWAATIVYLAALGLGLAALLHASWDEDGPGIPTRFLAAAAAVALAFSFSFYRAINPGESFLGLMDWLSALLLFSAALHVFKSDRAVKTLLAGIVPVIILEFFVLLYQQCVIDAPLTSQPPGTMVNSNLAAAFLLLWVPALANEVQNGGRNSRKMSWYWTAGLAADLAAILLCRSEWAMICLLIGFPLIIGPKNLAERLKSHPRLSALSGALFASALALVLWRKFFHVTDFTNRMERLEWWGSALRMFADYPLSGIGIGNFPSASPAYAVPGGQHAIYAHSYIFGLLAETGGLGFLSLLFFFTLWLRHVARHWEQAKRRVPYLVGAFLFLLYGSINLSLEYLVNLLVFWIFLGIVVASKAPTPSWKPGKMTLIILIALGFSAVPYLLSPLMASRICVAAENQLRLGQTDGALQNFSSASSLDPLSFEAQRGRAKALYARFLSTRDPRDLDGAVLHQKKAVELNKLSGPLSWELKRYLEAQEKLDFSDEERQNQ